MAAFGTPTYGMTKPLTQTIQGTMTGTTSTLDGKQGASLARSRR